MDRAEAHARLDRLWARGTEFLGTRVAIMGGAMSWVSERHLVSAISNAGGFGVIACGSMNPALLEAEIAATQALTLAFVRTVTAGDDAALRAWPQQHAALLARFAAEPA